MKSFESIHYQLILKQRIKQAFFVMSKSQSTTPCNPCLINLRNKVFLVKTFRRCRDLNHFTAFDPFFNWSNPPMFPVGKQKVVLTLNKSQNVQIVLLSNWNSDFNQNSTKRPQQIELAWFSSPVPLLELNFVLFWIRYPALFRLLEVIILSMKIRR